MKKILCLVLIMVLTLSMSGCAFMKAVQNQAGKNNGTSGTQNVISQVSEEPSSSETESTEDVSSEESQIDVSSSDVDGGDVTTTMDGNVQVFKYYGMTIRLPEGFTVGDTSASTPIAYHESYPSVADNITFTKTTASDMSALNADVFKSTYESLFDTFELKDYSQTKIGGKDAIRINYKISMSSIEMEQIQYMIFDTDATYAVTYTLLSDTYRSSFEASAQGITVG
ncbi:MAG: hypothetical protein ACI4II_08575 [Acutalibacteraceae bacterium]